MGRASSLVMLASLTALAVGASSAANEATSAEAAASCSPARVNYTPYPGQDNRLFRTPWIRGKPHSSGLVGLLWYWPEEWRKEEVREAQIFTHGVAPAGYSTKILWAFVARSARGRGGGTLVVKGQRLDGNRTFRQEFAAISYAGQNGAPSYASIIDVPEPGCWRLFLSTGRLRAQVDLLAVEGGELGRIP
jgi:hypothetical protein